MPPYAVAVDRHGDVVGDKVRATAAVGDKVRLPTEATARVQDRVTGVGPDRVTDEGPGEVTGEVTDEGPGEVTAEGPVGARVPATVSNVSKADRK